MIPRAVFAELEFAQDALRSASTALTRAEARLKLENLDEVEKALAHLRDALGEAIVGTDNVEHRLLEEQQTDAAE